MICWLTCLQVVLLLDHELMALPFEGLPLLRSTCAAVSRTTSLHALRVSMQRSPAAGELGAPSLEASTSTGTEGAAGCALAAPPSFELSRATYIVDARCEGSMAEQASGGFAHPEF